MGSTSIPADGGPRQDTLAGASKALGPETRLTGEAIVFVDALTGEHVHGPCEMRTLDPSR